MLEQEEPIKKKLTEAQVQILERCQNSEVGRGYGVTGRVHRRSFRADKTRLQLMCCALVQEPGCLVILEGRSPERGTGFRNGLRELWRVKQEE